MESVVIDCFKEFKFFIKQIQKEFSSSSEGLSSFMESYLSKIIIWVREMESNISKSSNSLRKKDFEKWKTYKTGHKILTAYLMTSNPTDKEIEEIFNSNLKQ